MSKFIQSLAAKRANLCRQRKAIEDAYLEQLESINAQIQRLDAAIDTVNEAIQPFICPACHGDGDIRVSDAAGGRDTKTCPICHGTGVNPASAT